VQKPPGLGVATAGSVRAPDSRGRADEHMKPLGCTGGLGREPAFQGLRSSATPTAQAAGQVGKGAHGQRQAGDHRLAPPVADLIQRDLGLTTCR
jgi:hypothetical protein